MSSFVSLIGVYKSYGSGDVVIRALDGASFDVEKGRFAVVMGPSGAGKTTILNILGGMDCCDKGSVLVDGRDIASCSARELTEYRRRDIGFVFQFYNLVANLTALENVELAAQISGNALDATEMLDRVGLSARRDNFPAQLSGGEQQRVSIARALSKNPKLLLCDEPTGALDSQTGKSILRLLQETSQRFGMTVVIVTHNHAIAPMADVVIAMRNGRVDGIMRNTHPSLVEAIYW